MPRFFVTFAIIFFSFQNAAYAYLDPGIFSFFWQGILIVLASAAMGMKIFWSKVIEVKNFLKKIITNIKYKFFVKSKK